jgi:hypothetical protein
LVAVLALASSVAAAAWPASAGAAARGASTAAPTMSATVTAASSPAPSIATAAPAGTPGPGATPAPSAFDLRPLLTSEVTVVNLGEGPLSVSVVALDPESDDEYEIGTFEIMALQVATQSVPPALFRLEFAYPDTQRVDAGRCTIEIADGEAIEFAVIEAGAVIAAGRPDVAGESVATSARCDAGGDA